MNLYRIWPDGTTQDAEETPYPWMSDDYRTAEAASEEDASAMA
jgi:hypothetical protein